MELCARQGRNGRGDLRVYVSAPATGGPILVPAPNQSIRLKISRRFQHLRALANARLRCTKRTPIAEIAGQPGGTNMKAQISSSDDGHCDCDFGRKRVRGGEKAALLRAQRRRRFLEAGGGRHEKGAGRIAELLDTDKISGAILGGDQNRLMDDLVAGGAGGHHGERHRSEDADRSARTRSQARRSWRPRTATRPPASEPFYLGSSNVEAGKQAAQISDQGHATRRQVL